MSSDWIAEVRGDPPHDFCYLDRDLTLVEFAGPQAMSVAMCLP